MSDEKQIAEQECLAYIRSLSKFSPMGAALIERFLRALHVYEITRYRMTKYAASGGADWLSVFGDEIMRVGKGLSSEAIKLLELCGASRVHAPALSRIAAAAGSVENISADAVGGEIQRLISALEDDGAGAAALDNLELHAGRKSRAEPTSQANAAATADHFYPARWFSQNTDITSAMLRGAIRDRRPLRTKPIPGSRHKLYSFDDAKLLWPDKIERRVKKISPAKAR